MVELARFHEYSTRMVSSVSVVYHICSSEHSVAELPSTSVFVESVAQIAQQCSQRLEVASVLISIPPDWSVSYADTCWTNVQDLHM